MLSCQISTGIYPQPPYRSPATARPSIFSFRLFDPKLKSHHRWPPLIRLGCYQCPAEAEPSLTPREERDDNSSLSRSWHRDDREKPERRFVQVPRQKHIHVPKAELLDAILMTMFDNQDEALQLLNLSRCLDAIIHAEHKSVLEDMRADYSVISDAWGREENFVDDARRHMELVAGGINSAKEQLPPNFCTNPRLKELPTNNARKCGGDQSRVVTATRFQRAFMQLLSNARFEELSVSDLMLTSALNTDYLLTLPVYVDWKKASRANAIIYRRGYATERQKGLLLVEKLDYLQSKLLGGILFTISKPLGKLGSWIIKNLKGSHSTEETSGWTKKLKHWLTEASGLQKSVQEDNTSNSRLEVEYQLNQELPIWLAAQKAVTRYEGILSPIGPRGRLLRKFLTWTGLVPPLPETPFELKDSNNECEPYLRPIFLSRISLHDIWRPVSKTSWANNVWEVLKTGFSVLFSQSILQEAAFQELVLLYTDEANESNVQDESDFKSLQVKIFERIPVPDLPVVFPHKRLSFRIIDTVRLDIATIVGLLAYIINYRFEDILSSPSAIFLDVIAISALVIFVIRVLLGYKQTRDRYQLLVNKTLYEKTLASGFGSVHFLLDASEQQQYKEAILAYSILLKANDTQGNACQSIGDRCERFMYDTFKEKVEMPVEEALETLSRLGLVTETHISGSTLLQAMPCLKAYEVLKDRWNNMLS